MFFLYNFINIIKEVTETAKKQNLIASLPINLLKYILNNIIIRLNYKFI
jgi:hypothetical protein